MTATTKFLFAIESFDTLDAIDLVSLYSESVKRENLRPEKDLQSHSKTFMQRFGDKFTATELQEDVRESVL